MLSGHDAFHATLRQWSASALPVKPALDRALDATNPKLAAPPAVAHEALIELERVLWWPLEPSVATMMAGLGCTCPPWLTEFVEANLYMRVIGACYPRADVTVQLTPPARLPYTATVLADEPLPDALRRLKAELREHRHWREPEDRRLPANRGQTLREQVAYFYKHVVLGCSPWSLADPDRRRNDQKTVRDRIVAARVWLPGLERLSR
jgi:hypothetical protein